MKRSKNVGAVRSKNNTDNRKADAMWNTPFMDGPEAPAGKGWNTPFNYNKSQDRIYRRKRGPDGMEQWPPYVKK